MRKDYPSQIIGDILLLNGISKRSKRNRIGQSIYSKTIARYSHVAFCLGVGEFIHSDTGIGVDLIFIDDLLSKYKGKWRAIRNKKMYEVASKDYMSVYNAANYYLSQSYNIKFKGLFSEKEPEDAAICSSLIAKIYYKLDIQLGRKPSKTLPVHFQKYLHHPEWVDVTKEHKIAIKSTLKCPDIRDDFIIRRNQSKAMQEALINHVEKYHQVNELLKANHKLMSTLGLKTEPYKKAPFNEIPIKHWNVKQPTDESE